MGLGSCVHPQGDGDGTCSVLAAQPQPAARGGEKSSGVVLDEKASGCSPPPHALLYPAVGQPGGIFAHALAGEPALVIQKVNVCSTPQQICLELLSVLGVLWQLNADWICYMSL